MAELHRLGLVGNMMEMPDKKRRVAIPRDMAARIQFLSNRTCCVCRERGKPIQVHHIDDEGSPGDGHGLIGMRERVAMMSGEFEARATETGFSVRARFPLTAGEEGR